MRSYSGESNFIAYYAKGSALRASLTELMGHVPNRTDAPRSQRDGEPHIMNVSELITEKLTEAFAPQSLRVVDESHQHAGHAGHREGGETHFRVYIVSRAFQGKSRLDRHRLINAALAGELASGVHALAIHAATPDEGLG
jgi:BolA family transcriptional regulator, general stress-responsive regulator